MTMALMMCLTIACGSKVEHDEGGAGGNGAGASVGGGSPNGGTNAGGSPTSGGGDTGPDLFACGLTYDCLQDLGHIGPIPEEHLRCGGELLASGQPGVILKTSQPGPYPTEIETLVVLFGNGTMLQQTRTRCSVADACMDYWGTEWERDPLENCNVEVDQAHIAGCGDPEGVCSWLAAGTNCAPVAATWTCQELP